MNKQVKIPSIGIKGTKGVLKARGASGFVFLNTITPMQTSINAKRVPILVISPTTLAPTLVWEEVCPSFSLPSGLI